ncbi:hypothetical protein MMC34_006308 [Xylographa carneopallida]|nr:hypothetical protein [Xylographa carneopallida]
MDGSVPNEAVVRLTNRKLKYDWCGPIIITAQTKIGISDNYPYEDVSLHDFRDIVDYFLSFDGTSTSTMMMQVSTKSRAVRIRCQAHMIASKAPKFSVENTNNIFLPYSWKPTECCVTLMIKLPLYLAHIPPDVKWGSKVEELINHTAACLELGQIFSEARRQRWYQDGGDAIVARADSRDLLPEHLEVLADFCEVEIVGLLTKAASNPSVMNTLKSVCTEHVTEKKFKLYWEKYQTKMSLSDPRWSSIPSPYY